jgi:hypothetical protein
MRHVFKADPDVPEDIDEHFNDMNWDYGSVKDDDAESIGMSQVDGKKSMYGSETDLDGASIVSSRAASRVQYRVQEYVLHNQFLPTPTPNIRTVISKMTHLIRKFERLSPTPMILQCQSALSVCGSLV